MVYALENTMKPVFLSHILFLCSIKYNINDTLNYREKTKED